MPVTPTGATCAAPWVRSGGGVGPDEIVGVGVGAWGAGAAMPTA